MSQKAPSSSTASKLRFQSIFQASLKSYQKQTKTDLLAHPLASQLQSCNSTSDFLALLQNQVPEFDKVHCGDERLTRWLGPTVNVLCAFSAAVSGGVSLVSLYTQDLKFRLICMIQVFSPASVIFAGIGVFVSASILSISWSESDSRSRSYRRPRMLQQVKRFLQSCSNASDTFLQGSTLIRRWNRLRR
jgi:hypothetical protein